MTRGLVSPAPIVIARRAGLRVEQRPSEFGVRFTIYDEAAAILYQSNRRECALAWLEGYERGRMQ